MNLHKDTLPAAVRMLSVGQAATALSCCRATINFAIAEYEQAVKAGLPPPPGSLKSFRWRARRQIPVEAILESIAAGGGAPAVQAKNLPCCSRRDGDSIPLKEPIHDKRKPGAR
jgi:hypothetical protein